MRVRSRFVPVFAAVGIAAIVAGCGSSSSGGNALSSGSTAPSTAATGPLVVGSAGFTESQLLAEMYAALLKNAGYQTSIKTVQNRELYEPALETGDIAVVPEYAATMAEFLNRKKSGANAAPVASADVDKTVAALNLLAEPLGLKALAPSKAVDQNAFVVSKTFADKNQLTTLSELGAKKIPVSLAAGEECKSRPFCAPGLEKTYGIKISKIDPLGVDTVQTKQSVKVGKNQLGLALTTDGTLADFGLVVLKDDKGLQNADNLLAVVNVKKAGGAKAVQALEALSTVLTTDDLAALNKKVDAERAKASDVAQEYLTSKGLL